MDQNIESKDVEEDYSPYCPICTSCGTEGCCSPIWCTQEEDCQYPKGSLADLKFGYLMYKDMWALIPDDAETQAKLDKIYDDNYDLIYKQ